MDSTSSEHENLALVGGYVLENLQITTHSNNKIFLAGRFDEINIYESIFSSVVFGDILVKEPYNFVSYGPIVGGEELKFICYNIPAGSERPTKRNSVFVIYAIENKSYLKDRIGHYLIRFCSKEAIYNQQIRICSTIYKKTYSQIAENIFSAFFTERDRLIAKDKKSSTDLDARRDINEFEKLYRIGLYNNEEKISIHFPNLHPFECLHLLAGKATVKIGTEGDHGNPYFFFEQYDNNYIFMSWSELVRKYNYSKDLIEKGITKDLTITLYQETDSQKQQKRNKYIFMSLPSIWGAEDSELLAKFDWFKNFENFATVEQHQFKKDFDFFENVKKGMYASTLVSFDNCTKKIVQHIWSGKHLYDKVKRLYNEKENALNIFNDQDSESNSKSGTTGTRISEYFSTIKYDSFCKATPTSENLLLSKTNDFYPELSKNLRIQKLQELNNNQLFVNIPGNLNYTVGTFTDVFMHSHEETLKKPRRDPHFAGTYLNLRVRHTFKPDGHFYTSLELAKDSFIEKTLQTFPTPDQEGT